MTGKVMSARKTIFQEIARRRQADRPQRFSTVLRVLAEGSEERLSVAQLVELFQDRVFGALMFLFALPNVVPLPPGSSSVLGAPLIVIAGQLLVGRRTLWLPKAILRQSVPRSDLKRLVNLFGRYLRSIERLLAPRLTFFFGPIGDRIVGAVCLILAIILFLPIPFGNILPALAICCFSLALLERDGVVALVGWIVAAAAISLLAAISGAVWLGFKAFYNGLEGIFS